MRALNRNQHYKQLLDTRFLELQTAVAKADEQARVDMETHADIVDRATSDFERESALSRKALAQQAIQTLMLARERMLEGTYGKCAECGGEIGTKRLQAIPWARYCVKCQEKAEQA
ncbi:MAG TPA: TraR/DksA family transcriptional regulator [Terriglobales bacterium]